MRLGFIGTGRMGHPMARKLIEAGHEVRALARSQDKRAALAAQLGVDEPVLLGALPHGSAASRALTAVASRGSVTAFAASVADFLIKDIEVARKTAATLNATLGPLDPLIAAATPRG
jgi:3-hydroxyisobutyrate dehydrogenase-like beta-hydroxyacid dehydrogenase